MHPNKIEFVSFHSFTWPSIPIPGATTEMWAGEDEPKIKATLISMHRDPHALDAHRQPGDKVRYRCHFVSSDSRMVALDQRCEHEVPPGHDYCVRCNIVPGGQTA